MAISDTQKVDYLFKKLGYGLSKTDIAENKQAFNESIPSPLLLRGDKVWQQSELIPAVKPASSTAIVEIYDDTGNGQPTVECVEDITSVDNRTWKTNLNDWVPVEFGSTYLVKVYIDDTAAVAPQTTGIQILAAGSDNNDEWFFDYQSGLLHFIGENLPSDIASGTLGKSVYVAGARYIGPKGVGAAPGSAANIGNLIVNDTTISTVAANANIVLDTSGAGLVIIDSSSGLVIPSGNDSQRPTAPVAGTIRYNTETTEIEVYNGTSWENAGPDFAEITLQTLSGDNSTTTFTLNKNTTAESILVNINGVAQVPDASYSVTGNQITFAEAPNDLDVIDIRYLSFVSTISAISNSSGNTKIQVQGTDIVLKTDSANVVSIGTSKIVDISNAHSLQLPIYATIEANALSNKQNGQLILTSDGANGQPCLAVYYDGQWKKLILGSQISDS